MPYIPPEVIEQARQIDLLSYLQAFEPNELVRISGNNYTTRTHDSLKISNGKWMWWSQRIGGYNALDYLVKVKEYSFVEAVETLMGKAAVMPTLTVRPKQEEKPKTLLLSEKSATTDKITEYLFSRGIDYSFIEYCIAKGYIFESLPYHNLVCVGFDENGKAKYAAYRATIDRRILSDCSGSDKHYSFRIADSKSDTVHLFECAVAGQRMKQAYAKSKEKAEHATHAQENSAEEYAADRLEGGIDRVTHETVISSINRDEKALKQQSRTFQKQKTESGSLRKIGRRKA